MNTNNMQARQPERGAVMVETALVFGPLCLLLFGVAVFGINLGHAVRTAQVNRDVGSMYVRGVDFTFSANKQVAVRLAQGSGMTENGGNGVIHMSKVTFVSDATCRTLRLSPCNANQLVVTQRVTVGNTALRPSVIGNPAGGLVRPTGAVDNYKQEASAVAQIPGLTLSEGEYAYVTETYLRSPVQDLSGTVISEGTYARAIF